MDPEERGAPAPQGRTKRGAFEIEKEGRVESGDPRWEPGTNGGDIGGMRMASFVCERQMTAPW